MAGEPQRGRSLRDLFRSGDLAMLIVTCPGCGGELRHIRMVRSPRLGTPRRYVEVQVKKPLWGTYPAVGYVGAQVCRDCRRVVWPRGRPSLPIPAGSAESFPDGLPIPVVGPVPEQRRQE